MARLPFQLALVTVTVWPDCDQFPFQPWVSVWLPVYAYCSVQLVTAGPVFVMSIAALNPVPQLLLSVYCTTQPAVWARACITLSPEHSAAAVIMAPHRYQRLVNDLMLIPSHENPGPDRGHHRRPTANQVSGKYEWPAG